jgi:hypothetical protein
MWAALTLKILTRLSHCNNFATPVSKNYGRSSAHGRRTARRPQRPWTSRAPPSEPSRANLRAPTCPRLLTVARQAKAAPLHTSVLLRVECVLAARGAMFQSGLAILNPCSPPRLTSARRTCLGRSFRHGVDELSQIRIDEDSAGVQLRAIVPEATLDTACEVRRSPHDRLDRF